MSLKGDDNMVGSGLLLTILRLLLAVGLGLILAGGVSTAAIFLPEIVEDTTARIWIGIGLFGLVIAGLAAIAVYALRAVGEDRVMGWIQSPPQVEDGKALQAEEEIPRTRHQSI